MVSEQDGQNLNNTSARMRRGFTGRAVVLCAIWIAVVAAGFHFLNQYGGTPGDPGNPAAAAPSSQEMPAPHSERCRLILFAHANCPCTSASIEALNRIAGRCSDRTDISVVIVPPDGDCAAAQAGELWASAALIDGVCLVCDADGGTAKAYGARTSGQVMLYDQHGMLLFAGGITPSRGHHGDCAGLDAIVSYLLDGSTRTSAAPVYGCALFDSLQ